MFDDRTYKLMHPHGERLFPMEPFGHHDAAQHDPEGRWRQGTRFFRCRSCPYEIAVVPSGEDLPTDRERE